MFLQSWSLFKHLRSFELVSTHLIVSLLPQQHKCLPLFSVLWVFSYCSNLFVSFLPIKVFVWSRLMYWLRLTSGGWQSLCWCRSPLQISNSTLKSCFHIFVLPQRRLKTIILFSNVSIVRIPQQRRDADFDFFVMDQHFFFSPSLNESTWIIYMI